MTPVPAFVSQRHLCAGASATAGVVGLWIALHHPLSALFATTAFAAWSCVIASRPRAWLFLLPALLPVLGLAPWSGWIGVDEFDLAVLATATGAYAACARAGKPMHMPRIGSRSVRALAIVLVLAGLGWVGLGLAHAPALRFGWFDGYDAPLNTLRVAKGLFWPLLLLPLLDLHQGAGEGEGHVSDGELLSRGMSAGLGVMVLAVLWERLAFTGLWNTEIYYRTTALFWEMHVGGAAIEVFLVLALPFAVAQMMVARSTGTRMVAMLLVALAAYACISTLSRSLYLALAVAAIPSAWVVAARRRRHAAGEVQAAWPRTLGAIALVACGTWGLQALVAAIGYAGAMAATVAVWVLALAAILLRRPSGARRWRECAALAVALLLMVELGALREGSAFLTARLDRVADDFVKRSDHWSGALSVLQTPLEWALGRGLGRFPADYPARARGVELPGAFSVVTDAGERFARVAGPPTMRRIAGVFGASQRVGPLAGESFMLTFEARTRREQPLLLSLCEKHLIYEAECAFEFAGILPGGWRRYAVPVDAANLRGGPWYAPRPVLFSVASAIAGGEVDVDNLRLVDAQGRDHLVNGDFSADAAHWFFTGRYYFLPWHSDSAVVELLVERGVVGLLLFAWLTLSALAAWAGTEGRQDPLSPYVVAALTGCVVLGVFGSVFDVPRNAFLLLLLCLLRPARKTA